MAERFDIHDERSFYVAGIRDLSGKIEDVDRLRLSYNFVRAAWLADAEEKTEKQRLIKGDV